MKNVFSRHRIEIPANAEVGLPLKEFKQPTFEDILGIYFRAAFSPEMPDEEILRRSYGANVGMVTEQFDRGGSAELRLGSRLTHNSKLNMHRHHPGRGALVGFRFYANNNYYPKPDEEVEIKDTFESGLREYLIVNGLAKVIRFRS